jgi:hypothetical protein
MKKILVFLSMSFMLFCIPSVSKLQAEEQYPIYTGDINKVEFLMIDKGDGYLIVEIGGKRYVVKVQS